MEPEGAGRRLAAITIRLAQDFEAAYRPRRAESSGGPTYERASTLIEDMMVMPNPRYFEITALPTWAGLILLGVLIGLALRQRPGGSARQV